MLGDFYQLLPVNDTSLIYPITHHNITEKRLARELWEQINYFKELTYNFRIRNQKLLLYTNFLINSRIGNISKEELLYITTQSPNVFNIEHAFHTTNAWNSNIIRNTENEFINPNKTVWLCATNDEKDNINKTISNILRNDKNKLTIDIISKYENNLNNSTQKDLNTEIYNLFKITNNNNSRMTEPILRLSIGSRVKVYDNIAVEIGILLYIY
jgi:hypothetical protein